METTENSENIVKEWQNRKYDFENIIAQIDYGNDPFKFKINNYLDRAGKLFFETTAKLSFSFTIPVEYRKSPLGKGLDGNNVWCFREYWLCIVGLFSREESSFLKYKLKLGKITLPEEYDKGSRWDCVQDESYLADVYFIRSKNYLKLICNASVDLCRLIISLCGNNQLKTDTNEKQLYIIIDKHFRKLTIGSQEFNLRGKMLWKFIEELVSSKQQRLPLPYEHYGKKWKHQVDTLRRQIGTEFIKYVLIQKDNAYSLSENVNCEGFSSIGYRKTYQKTISLHTIDETADESASSD